MPKIPMASTSAPSLVAQELAEVRVLNELADESGWDKKDKDYLDARNQIRKKYKDLAKIVKMNRKSGASQGHTTKEKWIWADKGEPLDADDFKEALAKLPEVFGEGTYGTSGVNSRGGKQNFRGELCAWKRKSKDGNHYRILEHTTGYIYQQGFPPSATEEPDEEDPEVDDKTGGDDGDQGEDRKTKKKRKNKKSPHPRSRREARVLRHLTRQERQRKGRPRRRPSAHPSVAAISRARDTYPCMYPDVSRCIKHVS